MMMILLSILSSSVLAQDVPGYPRATTANQDLGAVNQNYSELASRNKNMGTKSLTPFSCPAGQALTGSYYNTKSGATVGGTCTVVPTSSIVNSTCTFIGSQQTTTASTWITVAGSSLTLTMTGGRYTLTNSCHADNVTVGDCMISGFLVNGTYPFYMNATQGLITMCNGSSSSGSYQWTSTTTYTGALTTVLQFSTLSTGGTARFNDDGLQNCEICLREN